MIIFHRLRSPTVTGFSAVWLALLLSATVFSSAQELLKDPDFELDRGDGTPPTSGFWHLAYLGQAGSIVVANSGVTSNGFFLYTGASTNDFWTAPYQDVAASPGQVFKGSAFIRTPGGETQWVAGSSARVHLAFLDDNTNVINSFESSALTNPSSLWQQFQLTTEAAPPATAFVRYMCLVEKPRGETGLSIAVFDDCSLQTGTFTGLEAWPQAVGVPADVSTADLNIRNTGNTPVGWWAISGPGWLTVTPNSGTLEQGSTQALHLTVNRTQLAGTDCVLGTFQLLFPGTSVMIRLYVEVPSAPAPAEPTLVHVDGRRVVVQDRLPDGSLAPAENWTVKGVVWSPCSRDTPDVFDVRRGEFAKWYVTDIQLMRELNANTVYTFLDFGTNDTAWRVLDNLYKYGFKALVTVDENGTGNTNALVQIVSAYKQHPAILGWVIGNEWNINLYHGKFTNYFDAAHFTEEVAQMVKQLDTNHIVLSTHGDMYPPEMSELVNDLCPSVDVWGLNVYRGSSFTTLFDDWAGITGKPMMLSEFGTDAYRTLMLNVNTNGAIVSADGAVDEAEQATWERGLWRELAGHLSAVSSRGVCVGGTVFEWCDEWWKAQGAFGGQVGRHDTLGFYAYWNPESHPDSVANEEWWGLVSVDRQPRANYRFFQEDFAAVPASIQGGTEGHIQISWLARSNVAYTVYYHDGELTPGASFLPLAPFIDLTTPTNGPFKAADTNAMVSPARFYKLIAQPR